MKLEIRQTSLDAFHELSSKNEQTLENVFEVVEDKCREAIALKFSAGVLVLTVDADNDTIEVRFQELVSFDPAGFKSVKARSPWRSLIGQSIGWGWVTINQQGYQDGVLLSFDGLEPSVMLAVAASSLRVYSIGEVVS